MICEVLFQKHEELWKIAGFGFASIGSENYGIQTPTSRGTSGFRAPELYLNDAKYTKKVDIWALGCILYLLVVGRMLFQNDLDVDAYARGWATLDISLSNEIDDKSQGHLSRLIRELLEKEPQNRPSAHELLVKVKAIRNETIQDVPAPGDSENMKPKGTSSNE